MAAASALAACFPRTVAFVSSPIPSPANTTGNNSGEDRGSVSSATTDPNVAPTATQTPSSAGSVEQIEQLLVDKPELATASFVAFDDAAKNRLPQGALAAVEIRYASSEATPSDAVMLTLALKEGEWPAASYKNLQHFPLAKLKQTSEGITYYETAPIVAVDEKKKTVTFVPAESGTYVVLPPEQEPADKQDFQYYEGIGDQRTYQYDPTKDAFVIGGSGFHGSSNPYYTILQDEDIASASVLFSPGDGHEKENGTWHALKFYRYAYHYAKLEDRAWAWRRMVPMVSVYDTRQSIDKAISFPAANMRIGFSYGALRNRAGRAAANMARSTTDKDYLHHYGDISWAGEHLGIKIADPKAWRASTQGRPYATLLALAHGAFFHNLSTPLALRPLKNMEDPIRELGLSWQAYGHRSFFPPPRRYPESYKFLTTFRFGKLSEIPLIEELTPNDAYSVPCAAASNFFADIVRSIGKTISGECRYNFFEVLEYVEKYHGQPREIRYAGFFSDIPELIRANREFAGLLIQNISNTIQWKDRSAAGTRRALAWMQSEQAAPPHRLPCGDGLADCASALGYEGTEPLVVSNGNKLGLDIGALNRYKPDRIQYRVIPGATHADFVGMGSDDPYSFTDAERAIYDSTLADLRAMDAAAQPTGDHILKGVDARDGIRQYLGTSKDGQWDFDSSPYRVGPDRYEFTYWVKVRVPEVFHYVDESDDFYTAKFRWYNGRWWFDGAKPQYQYSRYINR